MASLIIENVPDELLNRLREQAALRRRSLSKQALEALQQGMAHEQGVPAEAEAQVRKWQRLAGRWNSDQSSEEEIRDLYAARSIGREVTL